MQSGLAEIEPGVGCPVPSYFDYNQTIFLATRLLLTPGVSIPSSKNGAIGPTARGLP